MVGDGSMRGVPYRNRSWKRVAGSLSILACLLTTFCIAAEPASTGRVATTTQLNLRSCPGTCAVVGAIEPRAELEVIGQQGEWLQVRVPSSGRTGWVSSKYTETPKVVPSTAEESNDIVLSRDGDRARLVDKVFFFSASLPVDWQVKKSNDQVSFWRASVAAPGRDFFVDFYALKAHGDVDLERFAANDRELLGKVLGEVAGSRKIKKRYFWTAAIEKDYAQNHEGLYARSRFYCDGTYGYIIATYSQANDFSRASPIFDSFIADTPFLSNVKNRLSGGESKSSSDIVKDLVGAIFLFAIPVGVGLLGVATRERPWLLTLLLLLCAGAGIALFVEGRGWWSLGIPTIALVLIFAGRSGVLMWLSD